MSQKIMLQSDYLVKVYQPDTLSAIVNKMSVQMIKLRKDLKFDAIAFSGFSGSSVAFPVSIQTGIPLLAVRKDADDSHHKSGYGVLEGAIHSKTYVILDDLISSGSTVERIISRIEEYNPAAQCKGIVLWNKDRKDYIWVSYETEKIPKYKDGIQVYCSFMEGDDHAYVRIPVQ